MAVDDFDVVVRLIVRWNGSFLGEIDDYVIQDAIPAKPYNMLELKVHNFHGIVSYHQVKNGYPAIIDEVAPIFGFPKIGTHLVRFKKKLCLIYNMNRSYRILSKDYQPIERYLIQDIIVFRCIMGLTCNWESSILIDEHDMPLSYRNNIDTAKLHPAKISEAVMERCFEDKIYNSLRRMKVLSIKESYYLREQIQKIINRIDPNLIWVENRIVSIIDSII